MQLLAIVRRRTETFSEEEFATVLEPEAQAVRSLYTRGIVRSIWSRGDALGGVLLLEADSLEAVQQILHELPMIERGMAEVQSVLPLKPYRGFAPH